MHVLEQPPWRDGLARLPRGFCQRFLVKLQLRKARALKARGRAGKTRSEEHTSELQSRGHIVCRLLLAKKKKYLSQSFCVCQVSFHAIFLYARLMIKPS